MRERLRKHRFAFLALLLAGAAAVLALLAVDARAWQSTVMRDDLRFRAMPAHTGLWKPPTVLPGDPAAALIGTGRALALRRALQYFWYTRIGSNPEVRQDSPALRASAQEKIQGLIGSAPNPAQRSGAANLLGVLVVTTPTPGGDRSAISNILKRAQSYFERAIALDAADVDAKQNLELVLRITKPGKGRLGKDARSGYGFGLGQGANAQGSGY